MWQVIPTEGLYHFQAEQSALWGQPQQAALSLLPDPPWSLWLCSSSLAEGVECLKEESSSPVGPNSGCT